MPRCCRLLSMLLSTCCRPLMPCWISSSVRGKNFVATTTSPRRAISRKARYHELFGCAQLIGYCRIKEVYAQFQWAAYNLPCRLTRQSSTNVVRWWSRQSPCSLSRCATHWGQSVQVLRIPYCSFVFKFLLLLHQNLLAILDEDTLLFLCHNKRLSVRGKWRLFSLWYTLFIFPTPRCVCNWVH